LYEPDGDGGSYPVAQGTALTGSFIFDTTLAKTITIGIRNDVALEGTETLGFTLRRDSIDGATVASKSVTINDTSYPTYSMANDTESNAVTEGATIRWNIVTTGVPSYSYLYWTNIGTTDGADFNDAYGNINYGSVLIVNNSGWFERTLKNDLTTEGTQNIIMDPPFTKLDVLSCRNLLIYMETELQKKLIPLFHYSLNLIYLKL
jgi:hypothetical protein